MKQPAGGVVYTRISRSISPGGYGRATGSGVMKNPIQLEQGQISWHSTEK